MFRWVILLGVPLARASTLAIGQTPARPTDPVFVKAQELVSDGNGVAGRALVDSVIKVNSPASRIYPEALFWRATLAASAADAESDYKHIVVDYPLAPQAEDALLRLAQLELARGDREGALGHLQRIPRDYPRSRSLARASYWTARVLFEKNDIPNACAANAAALAQAGSGEIELQNQIQYQGQRCASYNAARVSTTTSPPEPPVVKTPAQTTASSTPSRATSSDSLARVAVPGEFKRDTTVPPRTATAGGNPPVDPKPERKTTPSPAWSVQVAAYNHLSDAEKAVSGLNGQGYNARVDGDVAPFRVRIGRYSTRGLAEEALRKIKAMYKDGFVVRAPER